MEEPTGPNWSEAVEEADWIAKRLRPFGDLVVTKVVPQGFEAYARVLHPAEAPRRGHGRLVRWREVADWSGLPLGPDSQFHSIALPPTRPAADAPWRSQGPRSGSLFPADAEALARILRTWTSTPDQCWFCLWEGYGWENIVLATPPGQPSVRLPDPIPASARQGPRVQLPNRDYLLYSGPVEAVLATVPLADSDQTPNLWWPADRAWCVASEIDLRCTYVGGSAEMIEAVLVSDVIEALPAFPEDPLSRIEDWVTRWVHEAVDELWVSEEATITTSRGALYLSLTRPGRHRSGVLQVSSVGDNGVNGYRSHNLGPADELDLRQTVEWYLTWEVIGLVGG
jgi:hypothetical protein